MDYQEFVTGVVDGLNEYFAANKTGTTAVFQTIPKINYGGGRDAIILRSEQSMKACPTIYMDYLYSEVSEKVDVAIEFVLDVYGTADFASVDIRQAFDFDRVKDHLALKLISKDRSEAFLEENVYIDVLDLAAVFYFDVTDLADDCHGSEEAVSYVTKHLLTDVWHKGVEDLVQAVDKNIKSGRLTACCDDVINCVAQISPELGAELSSLNAEVPPLMVVTNERGINGAICVFYPDVLESLADSFHSDLAIIPSSVHECLVVPLYNIDRGRAGAEFRDLVVSVNETMLDASDFLSNNMYYYDHVTKKVEIM